MRTLTRQGNQVLFIETTDLKRRMKAWTSGRWGFREIEPRLYAYTPMVIPLPRFRPALWANQWFLNRTVHRWMRMMEFGHPILWILLPTALTIQFAKKTPHKLVVYHCMDHTADQAANNLSRSERRFLSSVDMIFAGSPSLQTRCAQAHQKVYTFPPEEGTDSVEGMATLIQGELEVKRYERESSWEKRWGEWSRSVVKRMTRFAATLALIYLLIFHTPFVWWMARPLKVSESPRKADAIVVLAGGVGESGQPGQGYEERVAQGVDFYRSGYAPKIILASGYSYRFQETEMMKTLALSLGVPNGAILLEQEGHNTYAQAQRITALLNSEKAQSALLVSAPYHMRRALWTFRRQGTEIHWIPTPVAQSLFYGHEGRIRMEHIRALLHEYLAIAYYWMKGWL